jgi:hypothetical protein
MTVDKFPRRNQRQLLTPAEIAIQDAIIVLDKAGAHPLLTDALDYLKKAQSKVADFVDKRIENKA